MATASLPPLSDKRLDFEPGKWGPHAWAFLHAVTYSYPENPRPELQHQMRTFFDSLKVALPCTKCRDSYADKFERTARDPHNPFASRTALTRWLRELHNEVNQGHGKPTWDEKQCTQRYMHHDQLCTTKKDDGDDDGDGDGDGGTASQRRHRRLAWQLLVLLILLCAVGLLLLWQTCRVCSLTPTYLG